MYDIEFVKNSAHHRAAILERRATPATVEEMEDLRSHTPRVYQVETTNVCNMKCVMCPRTEHMTRSLGHMRQGLFERIVDQIEPHAKDSWERWERHVKRDRLPASLVLAEDQFYYEICARALTLHGFGEPIFDPKLKKRVEASSKRLIPTYFSMNPVNVRLSMVEALADSGLSYLKFSLDGTDNDKQEKYRGRTDSSYQRTVDRIVSVLDLLRRKQSQTKIIMTKLRFNEQDETCDDFLRFWKQFDVIAYVKNQHNRWLYEEEGAPSNQSEYMTRYCEFPWSSMTILYDGTVVPCPLDYDGKIKLGDANSQTLETIWNGGVYRQFRQLHVTGNFPKNHFCKTQCDIPVLHEFH